VEFANRVSEALARTGDRGSEPTAAQSPPPGTAGDSLRRLQDLRDQGLITEGEYSAKRSEILARL
jgi:hypothetical protein